MTVEIYGPSKTHTVSGETVTFVDDSASNVSSFVAQIDRNGLDGRDGVTISRNGNTQTVPFGKTVYEGSVNVTSGTLTETYSGGPYDPTNIPSEISSAVEENMTLKTASGAIAQFDCELGDYPAQNVTIAIEPVQDLNGYDSPWPAGGGKNLLPTLNQTQTINGVTWTLNSDGTVKLTGTASANSVYDFGRDTLTLPAGDYTTLEQTATGYSVTVFKIVNGSAAVLKTGGGAFSLTESTSVFVRYLIASGTTINTTIYPQIESGSATAYAPYSNICPISGWAGANVTRTGANIWGGEKMADDMVAAVNNSSYCAKGSDVRGNFVKLTAGTPMSGKAFTSFRFKDNTRYTVILVGKQSLGTTNATNMRVKYTDGTSALLPLPTASADTIQTAVFNTAANKTVESIGGVWADGSFTLYYEESGVFEGVLTVAEFQPYTGTTYSITFPTPPRTVYGGTLDVTTGGLKVTHGFRQFSGAESEAWYYLSLADTFYIYNPSMGTVTDADGICNMFSRKTTWSAPGVRFGVGNTIVYFMGLATVVGSTDPSVLRSWLSENPLQIAFALATPQTYQLTAQEVQLLAGENNIWADTGDSTVEYYDGDITSTDVLTESGALISGETAIYPLATPLVSSITPASVPTVSGTNVMSANTGSITVSWATHWADITPWIAWQGLTFSRNDVDAPDAGRDMSGYMHRGRVAIKEKMNINTVPLTKSQVSTLQSLLKPATIQVRVTPYPETNATKAMYMYSNNVKTTYIIHRESGEDIQSLSFPLIEL